MGSRRPSASLGLAVLLLAAASCLTALDGDAAEREEVDCGSHINCSSCLNITLKNSSCVWIECKEANQSGCKNTANKTETCAVYSNNTQCLVTPTNGTTSAPITTSTPVPGNTTNTTSTASPQVTTNTPATLTTSIPGTQSPRKSTFDASSFIGGIVLVLGLQAVIFFLYKFCKSKDQNYHTL